MKKMLIAALVSTAMLAGCAEDGTIGGMQGNEVAGGLLGAAAGGFLGGQFGGGSGKTALAVTGALLGAWAGSSLAKRLSAQDRGYYDQAANTAATAPVGKQITWYNPNSGAQGTITPTRVGQSSDGEYCREYQQTITVGGRTERAYGTACRQPDGSWKVVN